MQYGTATRRDGVDRHHRCAQPHAGDRGFEGAFELAIVQRDVGGCAAHVEADDAVEACHGRGARGADDAAGGAGQDRVLAMEAVRLGQATVRLHKEQSGAGELAFHLGDVAAQDRREIRIHHRGVAAWDQPQQRADLVAGGHLGEADLARDVRQALLLLRIFPGVHQHDGAGPDALGVRRREFVARGGCIEMFHHFAVDADTAVDLDDGFVEHRRQGDGEVEQARAGLVADAQGVGKASVHHQQGAVALALEQGVGGDSGAHLDGGDVAEGDRRVERQLQQGLDTGDGGVAVTTGVFRQQLVGDQCAVGVARDDIGEGTAAVDPELPLSLGHAARFGRGPAGVQEA